MIKVDGRIQFLRSDSSLSGSSILVGRDEQNRLIRFDLQGLPINPKLLGIDPSKMDKEKRILYVNDNRIKNKEKMEKEILELLKDPLLKGEYIHPPKWYFLKSGVKKSLLRFFSRTPARYTDDLIMSGIKVLISELQSKTYIYLYLTIEENTGNKTEASYASALQTNV